MPAKESFNHTAGCRLEFPLKTGGVVRVRNGCVYRDGESVADSAKAAEWLKQNCRLTVEWESRIESVINLMHDTRTLRHSAKAAPISPAHGSKFKEGE